MAIIKGEIDPYWHESYLIILILNKGPLPKGELFKEIKQEQKKRTVLGEKDMAHSKSAYYYWLKSRRNQWVVSERGDMLELTPVGKWIANSKLGTFFDRDDLINFVCPKCIRPGDLALLKPLSDTAETNAKGRLFMRVDCPRYDYTMERWPISIGLSKGDFMDFYEKALTELQKLGEKGVKIA